MMPDTSRREPRNARIWFRPSAMPVPCSIRKRRARYCPVQHKQWPKGGCTTTIPLSIGARLRYQIDRDSEQYKEVYKQRTATERINSQATELGIERPKLRNGRAIANLNTLIYVLINLRALQRIRQIETEQAHWPPLTHALQLLQCLPDWRCSNPVRRNRVLRVYAPTVIAS